MSHFENEGSILATHNFLFNVFIKTVMSEGTTE